MPSNGIEEPMRLHLGDGWVRAAGMLVLGLLIASNAWAGGLRCSFGEVVVSNLKIGKSYSLSTLAHLPLAITNTDTQPTTVRVDALVPGDSELKQGAQAIPSATWAKAQPDSFVLAPNESRSVELMLSIPDDEALFGKKFEVIYWSHTLAQAGNLLAYGLKSRVIFTVDLARDTSAAAPTGELGITLTPFEVVLHDATAGHEYALEDAGHHPITVKNISDHPLNLELQVQGPQDAGIGAVKGFDDLPASARVKLTADALSLAPGEEKPVTGTVSFPKDASIKGRKFVGVLSATVVGNPVRTQIQSRIYVHAK
jgi:hypothetical protein